MRYPTRKWPRAWYREYRRRHESPAGYVRTKLRYSAEQKAVVIEHYLGHGSCQVQTSKALGYLCRETLSAWIAQHDPEARRRVVGKAAATPLPEPRKRVAVIDLCFRQRSAREVDQSDDREVPIARAI